MVIVFGAVKILVYPALSLRSSLRQHGKQHTKGKEDRKDNKIKKAEGGTDDLRVKEVTLDEKLDILGPNTTSEDCKGRPGSVKEDVTEVKRDEKAVIKATEIVVKSTAKPLILHSTLC